MVERDISIPHEFSKLFWDVNWADLDPVQHQKFIIERVLNMGDQDSLRWLRSIYSEDEILDTVKTSRKLSRKTARCWQNYFHLREDQVRCFSTYSMSSDGFY